MKYIVESTAGDYYKGDHFGARMVVRRLEESGVEYTATYGGKPVEIAPAERVSHDGAAAKDRKRRRLSRRIGWY